MQAAKKFDDDKLRMDLIPAPAMKALAEVLTFGARKYAPWNWSKGFNWSRLYGAQQRHMTEFWSGQDRDPETGLLHLAHALCCNVFLLCHQMYALGTDDRWRPEKK